MKKLAFLFASIVLFACSTPAEKVSLSIDVEGMSCSHSCAPYIQKKLLQTAGVVSATVSYENKKAEVIINSNEVSKQEIIDKIQTIANGQYKVEGCKEEKVTDQKPTDSKLETSIKDASKSDFDISKTEVSSAHSYKLPNFFNLLNSLLR